MKISFFALHLGYGGVEKYIITLANMLCKKHDVEILSTYKIYDKPSFALDERVKVTYLMKEVPNKEAFYIAKKSRNYIAMIKEGIKSVYILWKRKKVNVKAVKNCNADVMISTRIFHNEIIAKYAKENTILITSEHNHPCGNEQYIQDVLNSTQKFDYLLPISKELTNLYKERGCKAEVKFIPFCIDAHEYKENENFGSPVFISVGRLSQEKGYLDLMDVFEGIHDRIPEAILHIAGDGDQFDIIQEKIKSKHLEDAIIMHGFLNKEEIYKLMGESTLYLMTSFTESFGIVLLEAMSCGVPCIAYDSAQGAHEIIENGKNGYLIQERNKEEMIEKVCDLLNDKETLETMKNNCLKVSETYSYEVCEKAWLAFIDALTKS